ncbi:hypothetical protein FPSE5266_01993 [Fusarium pseudograminearum]|nr:hypothetical protein FPSE5266_01993 [Fusarium pseudograminearum]
MHEVQYPDYKLFPAAFEAWLRAKFDDPTITVECKNGHFVFNLPDGKELTDDDDREIYRLRGRKSWPLMQETIKEAMLDDPSLSPTPAEGLSKSFAATLLTHLIHLQWCDESWRLCINDFEERIRTVLSKAKTARVHQQSGIHTTVKRALTSKSNTNVNDKSEKHTAFRNTRLQLNKNGWEALTSYLCLTPITGNTSEPVPREKEMVDEGVSNRLEALMVLDTFSINEAQKLHDIGEHLENFRQIKISCKAELASFSRHVERIRKNLEIRVTQIESLIAWLKEGKVLFDGILQYRNTQVSHMFTESSHIQSEKMKKIAYKTEKETISMHVIMCVTLAFLPGTFVAAFFQSGLIEINQAASGVRGAVTFHSGAFKLFASICFPLMFIIFVLWILLFRYLARRARRREEQGKV